VASGILWSDEKLNMSQWLQESVWGARRSEIPQTEAHEERGGEKKKPEKLKYRAVFAETKNEPRRSENPRSGRREVT